MFGRKRALVNQKPSVTGGTKTVSGAYTVHTFTASSTFTTNVPITIDLLLVGGGGGGGGGAAGSNNFNGSAGGSGVIILRYISLP